MRERGRERECWEEVFSLREYSLSFLVLRTFCLVIAGRTFHDNRDGKRTDVPRPMLVKIEIAPWVQLRAECMEIQTATQPCSRGTRMCSALFACNDTFTVDPSVSTFYIQCLDYFWRARMDLCEFTRITSAVRLPSCKMYRSRAANSRNVSSEKSENHAWSRETFVSCEKTTRWSYDCSYS